MILIPCYNRPEFFYMALESLVQCRNIEDYKVYFDFEKDTDSKYKEIIEQIMGGKDIAYRIKVWQEKMGQTKGILEGIKRAFQESKDYIVVLEDDVRVSKDYLEYIEYCYKNFYEDSQEIAAVSGNRSFKVEGMARSKSKLHKRQWYCSWGVCLSKGFYEDKVREHCTEDYYENKVSYCNTLNPSWEHNLQPESDNNFQYQQGLINRIIDKNGMTCLEPEVARSQEIGWYGKHFKWSCPLISKEGYSRLSFMQRVNWNKDKWNRSDTANVLGFDGNENSQFVLNKDNKWKNLEIVDD